MLLIILLIIIAIGVLLASEAGQKILMFLVTLLIILAVAGGFAAILIGISTNDAITSFVFWTFGAVFGGIWLYAGGYHLIKIIRDKNKRVEVWRKLKKVFS